MRYSGQPLNKPVDVSATGHQASPVYTALGRDPTGTEVGVDLGTECPTPARAENLAITTLDQQGTASSWWNNLSARQQTVKPAVSDAGRTLTYDLGKDTCGIVIAVASGKTAADFDVPTVRAVVAETWKQMDIEIEWAYEPATADKDYSGRIETYDGG